MYWECERDARNEAVSSAMSRARFKEIMRYVHFCDNAKLDASDKFANVRPFLSMVNERFLAYFPAIQQLSVDELQFEVNRLSKYR